MKKLLAILLTAVACTADSAQMNYQVEGVCPAEVKMVYLLDLSSQMQAVDSATVAEGRFQMTGEAMKDALLGLSANGSQTVTIFFNDGQPVRADLTTGVIHASELNNRLNGYDCRLDSLNMLERKLNEQFVALTDATGQVLPGKEEEVVAIVNQERGLSFEQMSTYTQIMQEENLIPMVYLEELVTLCNAIGNKEMKERLLSSERPYYNHPMGRRTVERIRTQEQKQQIVGQPFIDLEEADMDGVSHRLSEYCGKGNYVFIDFWASWCGPCMAEMPNVKANYEKYHPKGFQIVGLSFDQKAEAWKKAVRDKELNWIHLSDLKGWQTVAAETYNINSIPSSLLIDPEGKVIARDLRGPKLGEKLQEIYGF